MIPLAFSLDSSQLVSVWRCAHSGSIGRRHHLPQHQRPNPSSYHAAAVGSAIAFSGSLPGCRICRCRSFQAYLPQRSRAFGSCSVAGFFGRRVRRRLGAAASMAHRRCLLSHWKRCGTIRAKNRKTTDAAYTGRLQLDQWLSAAASGIAAAAADWINDFVFMFVNNLIRSCIFTRIC